MVLTGISTTPVSVILSGWCLLTAAIFHKDLGDQTQMIMFLKNMAMAGGFLVLAETALEAEAWSSNPRAENGVIQSKSRVPPSLPVVTDTIYSQIVEPLILEPSVSGPWSSPC